MRTNIDSLHDWSSQLVSVIGHSDPELDHFIDELTAEWNQLNVRCQAEINTIEESFNQATVFRDQLEVSYTNWSSDMFKFCYTLNCIYYGIAISSFVADILSSTEVVLNGRNHTAPSADKTFPRPQLVSFLVIIIFS